MIKGKLEEIQILVQNFKQEGIMMQWQPETPSIADLLEESILSRSMVASDKLLSADRKKLVREILENPEGYNKNSNSSVELFFVICEILLNTTKHGSKLALLVLNENKIEERIHDFDPLMMSDEQLSMLEEKLIKLENKLSYNMTEKALFDWA